MAAEEEKPLFSLEVFHRDTDKQLNFYVFPENIQVGSEQPLGPREILDASVLADSISEHMEIVAELEKGASGSAPSEGNIKILTEHLKKLGKLQLKKQEEADLRGRAEKLSREADDLERQAGEL